MQLSRHTFINYKSIWKLNGKYSRQIMLSIQNILFNTFQLSCMKPTENEKCIHEEMQVIIKRTKVNSKFLNISNKNYMFTCENMIHSALRNLFMIKVIFTYSLASVSFVLLNFYMKEILFVLTEQ